MGDPNIRRLPVYVPPGYDAKRKVPYPVVYLLAGWSGRGARYLADEGAFTVSLPDRLDQMITNGDVPPLLVVFPDGATKLGASQYINSAANGPYMDYLCDEIVSFVDSKFHTFKSREFRGVLGHSSGGFGAMVTGMLRPDTFAYFCSSAGDSWYEQLYQAPIPTMIGVIQKAGGVRTFMERFLESPNPGGLLKREDFETMMNLSMCACYAPNLSVPVLCGDLYFDIESGELIPEAWNKFLAWDPVRMVERYADALRQMKWIHLEAGTEDEYGLHIGHRQVARRLKAHGISFYLEEYPGKHSGHHYRFGDRIRKMLEKMPLKNG